MTYTDAFLYPRRIHIAPVGYEIDRVVLPLLRMEADLVYLISEQTMVDESDKVYVEKIREFLNEQKRIIGIEEIQTDFVGRDLYEILRIYRDIIGKESGNQIFINVSTGTKIHAIAGMMACMIFRSERIPVIPYYVVPEQYENRPLEGMPLSTGCKEIMGLPGYRIERPPEELVRVLAIIRETKKKYGYISKKMLINELRKAGILLISGPVRHENIARYRALDRKYIQPLTEWRFITVEKEGSQARIEVTREGENVLAFLG
ncbi:MAG: hypothetical protein JXA44_12080 [Methanospirillaceae archaeon]|nr:hypothetical protein [Methanospirillaceae archaeon]